MAAKTADIAEGITLSPRASLRFTGSGLPWQQELFELGALSGRPDSPVAAFWAAFASRCVTALCHAAFPDAEAEGVASLEYPGDLGAFCNAAPPMPGGEYLEPERLRKLWGKLLEWCAAEIALAGGIAPFLESHAPGWQSVGTVFFHLGENRLDPERPFAFLATYATGLNAKGELRHKPLAHALRQYAADNKTLARILEPLGRAADRVPWAKTMLESGAIYRPAPWTAKQAHKFLLATPALEDIGIGIRVPDWWKKRPRVQAKGALSQRKDAGIGLKGLLDFKLTVGIGDENLDEEELRRLLEDDGDGLVLVKNQWVEVDREKLDEALAHWRKVEKMARAGELTFIQGMRLLAGFDAGSMVEEDIGEIRQWTKLEAGPEFLDIIRKARAENQPESLRVPGLNGALRPYQAKGVAWARFLNSLGLGACLADDMGLGKTIQMLALLLLEKDRAQMPALLVAPASIMANWKAECARFAPSLRLLVLHSSAGIDPDDPALREKLGDYDLVVTSYAMASRLKWLEEVEWSRVMADEAQNIKNSHTRQSMAVRKLRAPARIALTGTPIENRIGDLWALFDFINPGLLGSAKEFTGILKKLKDSPDGLAPVRRLAAPYILRRMKTDKNVIDSLPDKTEVTLNCGLSREQAKLYRQVTAQLEKLLLDSSGNDRGGRNIAVLRSLTLLKQVCNHPVQAGMAGEYSPERSGKFMRVGEICAALASRQERVLVFTQFKEIIEPLRSYLAGIFGAPGLVLHGGTPVKKRGELVEQFQREDGPPFFILSLKAGGSGLNLTAASQVIHFDRWWNPAVEDQATDRAFRIGQGKNVLVHKCVTLGTLEEKIDGLIQAKRDLAGQILDNGGSHITDLSDEEILGLVRLDAGGILE